MKYQHEQAYLLAKGHPPLPEHRISDVRELKYTGNALHPTQKAVMSLTPLIRAFTLPDDIVLDPFLRFSIDLHRRTADGPQIHRY